VVHQRPPKGQSLSVFLSTWLALKVSTRRSVMVISVPVRGLRPTRGRFSRTLSDRVILLCKPNDLNTNHWLATATRQPPLVLTFNLFATR
jgi:hypothetical protein